MKRHSARLMILTAAAIFLLTGSFITAQTTETIFQVRDRVKANVYIINPEIWQEGTVIKIIEARNISDTQKDSVIGALADAVAAQGAPTKIEAKRLTEVHIPYDKAEDLNAKMISRSVEKVKSLGERVWKIYVVVTDKRYLIFTRSYQVSDGLPFNTASVAIDETGTIIGGRFSKPDNSIELPVSAAQQTAENDRFYWANHLLSDKFAGENLEGKWRG